MFQTPFTFAISWYPVPHGHRQAGPHLGPHKLVSRIAGEVAFGVHDGRGLRAHHRPVGHGLELLTGFHCRGGRGFFFLDK